MTGAARHIIRDLSDKCASDVSDAVMMTAALLSAPEDRLMIALAACGISMGHAAGFADMKLIIGGRPPMTAEQKVDLIWSILRPIALKALGGGGEPFEQLLDRCRA